jgi:hypothetical protein
MEFNQARMIVADTALTSVPDWIIAVRPFSGKAVSGVKTAVGFGTGWVAPNNVRQLPTHSMNR